MGWKSRWPLLGWILAGLAFTWFIIWAVLDVIDLAMRSEWHLYAELMAMILCIAVVVKSRSEVRKLKSKVDKLESPGGTLRIEYDPKRDRIQTRMGTLFCVRVVLDSVSPAQDVSLIVSSFEAARNIRKLTENMTKAYIGVPLETKTSALNSDADAVSSVQLAGEGDMIQFAVVVSGQKGEGYSITHADYRFVDEDVMGLHGQTVRERQRKSSLDLITFPLGKYELQIEARSKTGASVRDLFTIHATKRSFSFKRLTD